MALPLPIPMRRGLGRGRWVGGWGNTQYTEVIWAMYAAERLTALWGQSGLKTEGDSGRCLAGALGARMSRATTT